MKRLAAVVALPLLLAGCPAFFKAVPFLPKPDDVACAAKEVERNVTDPFVIAKDCPGLAETAATDVEALIVYLLASKKAAHRAAAEHEAEACDGGPPVRTLNFANDNDAGRGVDASK